MQSNQLAALAFALLALALLLIAGLALARAAAARRSERTLARALDQRAQHSAPSAAGAASPSSASAGAASSSSSAPPARDPGRLVERFARMGAGWLDTRAGRQLVAPEDRRLLEQCGFVDTRARSLFLVARLAGAIVLPVAVAMLAAGHVSSGREAVFVAFALIGGFMLPKIYIQRRAAARRRAVVDELPMLVDLLRLLQGVGLSLDQSLQVMVGDFRGVLPVLSRELEIAQRQFVTGRTREQSLQRLASSYENEDLRAIVRLLVQVDRHGGAVQEPLKQFGDRLREVRRAMLRERVGRLAVKMTGVMVVTLLPALMIVTAGPGILAVTHSLQNTKR